MYACIEADGLLRLWKWGDQSGGWRWTYLNKCNVCACRDTLLGSRVLAAAVCPDPETAGRGSSSRHRIFWEQEDSGEGAGLGLDLTPDGPQPPRTVWSRRITFEAMNTSAGEISLDAYGSGARGEAGIGEQGLMDARLEISVGFAVRLLPMGCDRLLCSRHGTWVIAGERIIFNHFETGRLPETLVIRPLQEHSEKHALLAETAATTAAAAAGGETNADSEDSLTDSEGDLGEDEDSYSEEDQHSDSDLGEGPGAHGWKPVGRGIPPRAEPLFAVHDTTGDLMMYDPSSEVIRVVGLPTSGVGGLSASLQCGLEPPPMAPPQTFAVRLNQAILVGGEVCSVYDLCTGRLLGAAAVAWCRTSSSRGRRRSGRDPGARRRRRLEEAEVEPGAGGSRVGDHPVLWMSATHGHLVGLLSATRVLRVRPPGPETCAEALLDPSHSGGSRREAHVCWLDAQLEESPCPPARRGRGRS